MSALITVKFTITLHYVSIENSAVLTSAISLYSNIIHSIFILTLLYSRQT